MAKKFRFQLKIDDDKQSVSKGNGLSIAELAKLLKALDAALDTGDSSFRTVVDISENCYAPVIETESEKYYEDYLSLHDELTYKRKSDLTPSKASYAKVLKDILIDDRFLEAQNIEGKAIAKIYGRQFEKEIETYSVIENVVGIISEIGSKSLENRTHIDIDGVNYRIFTTDEQDKQLKDHYRQTRINFKVKQRRSVSNDKILSAQLLSFEVLEKGSLVDNLSKVNQEAIDNLFKDINNQDDILSLIRL